MTKHKRLTKSLIIFATGEIVLLLLIVVVFFIAMSQIMRLEHDAVTRSFQNRILTEKLHYCYENKIYPCEQYEQYRKQIYN